MDDQGADAYARAPEPEDLVRICRSLNDAGARYDHTVVRVVDEVIVDLMGRASKDTVRPQDAIDRSFLQQVLERRRQP